MSLRDYLFYEEPGITLYCGDCHEILPLLGWRAPLMLTDPPYGINSVRPDGRMGGQPAKGHGLALLPNQIYLPVRGDDCPLDPRWLIQYAERLIIWGAAHFDSGIPPIGRLLIWDKRAGMPSNDFADAEVAWDSHPGPTRLFCHRQLGMLHDGYGDTNRVHPDQKPLAVITWCLSLVQADINGVLDPYCGSGTTLRAAKDLGRDAIGIEIEPKYCEIAVKRLRQEVLL